jgi:hypothetical protein
MRVDRLPLTTDTMSNPNNVQEGNSQNSPPTSRNFTGKLPGHPTPTGTPQGKTSFPGNPCQACSPKSKLNNGYLDRLLMKASTRPQVMAKSSS